MLVESNYSQLTELIAKLRERRRLDVVDNYDLRVLTTLLLCPPLLRPIDRMKVYGGCKVLMKGIVVAGFISLLLMRILSVSSNGLSSVLSGSLKEPATTIATKTEWKPSENTSTKSQSGVHYGNASGVLLSSGPVTAIMVKSNKTGTSRSSLLNKTTRYHIRGKANATSATKSLEIGGNANVSALSPSGLQVTFSKYRYYIYKEETITKKKFLTNYRKANLEPNDPQLDHIVNDAGSEDAILAALEKHPWRTRNADEADFFIVPTPIATLLAAGGGRNASVFFDEAFGNLTSHRLFRQNSHRHIITSLHWVAFTRYAQYANDFAPALSRNYARLANVTIATHMDAKIIKRTYQFVRKTNMTLNAFRGFQYIFATFRQATCCSFSLGIWAAAGVPLLPASYETWKQKTVSIFYHTRPQDSGSGSTPYRHGPLNLTSSSLPANTSIGSDIPRAKWIDEFPRTRFCISIRGDTPQTHALLRAVRVGCIPVVISDFYPIFAPTFRSTLELEDFCIFIKEDKWQKNMTKQMHWLMSLDEGFLRNKTKYLAWAQRVIYPDQDDSLFVPAFLKEAANSVKRMAS